MRSGSGFSLRLDPIPKSKFSLWCSSRSVFFYANLDPHQSDANPQHRPTDPPLSYRVNGMWAFTESFFNSDVDPFVNPAFPCDVDPDPTSYSMMRIWIWICTLWQALYFFKGQDLFLYPNLVAKGTLKMFKTFISLSLQNWILLIHISFVIPTHVYPI